MALYPYAVKKLLPENATQAHINPDQVILHSAVDAPGPTSLYGFFARAEVVLESHFFVTLDGTVEQYIDTNVRADANYKVNSRAVSIETEDDGNPDQRPWTEVQLHAIRRLLEWLTSVHEIPRQVCAAWDKPGVGYHCMWGAPSPWTPVKGKSCPGDIRVIQFFDFIVPWLYQPTEDVDAEEEIEMVILTATGRPAALLSGDGMVQFADKETVAGLQKAGVKVAPVTVKDYDLFDRGFNRA